MKTQASKTLKLALALAMVMVAGMMAAPSAQAQTFTMPAQNEQPSTNSIVFTTLFNFDGTNGAGPTGNLVQGTDGNLYGTASAGGASANSGPCAPVGCGTIFKITPTGTLTTLYNFCSQTSCTDGNGPMAGLALGVDGSFYGTTIYGGTDDFCGEGCGTIFKITPGGTLRTLHSFDGYPTDGSAPLAVLIQATDGNFYGTTHDGGTNADGTVFKITPGGTLTTLHSLAGYPTEGSQPLAGLIQATDGNFYGTASSGGAYGYGTVFKITSKGALPRSTAFAPSSAAPTARAPRPGWSKAPTATSTGQPHMAGPTRMAVAVLAVGRSSKSAPGVH